LLRLPTSVFLLRHLSRPLCPKWCHEANNYKTTNEEDDQTDNQENHYNSKEHDDQKDNKETNKEASRFCCEQGSDQGE